MGQVELVRIVGRDERSEDGGERQKHQVAERDRGHRSAYEPPKRTLALGQTHVGERGFDRLFRRQRDVLDVRMVKKLVGAFDHATRTLGFKNA